MEKDVCCEKKSKKQILKEECKFIRPIEKGIASNEASEKFGVPKNAISTWMKTKRSFSALQETLSPLKNIRSCNCKEVDKAVYDWFNL